MQNTITKFVPTIKLDAEHARLNREYDTGIISDAMFVSQLKMLRIVFGAGAVIDAAIADAELAGRNPGN